MQIALPMTMEVPHPHVPAHDFDIVAALSAVVAARGSDLHIKAGNRPLIRVDGEIQALDDAAAVLEPEDTERVLQQVLPQLRVPEFERRHEVDFSYAVHGVARFRVNAFVQRGAVSLVFRCVPYEIKSIGELGLPDVVRELAEEERGIVLVTGTTGSGKSTTLAAVVDHINKTRKRHIVTVEDPIEFLHLDQLSAVNQREVGSDTESFPLALERVLRQDPDVILIGEMRDVDTVRTALSAAQTGHLVLSTLHTLDAAESVNRIIDFFPLHEHRQVRSMLAGTLRGVVSQRLVPLAGGRGRTPICEILKTTGRAHQMISDPDETGRLCEVIAEGGYYGMQTFDQALYEKIVAGMVTESDAMAHAGSPHDLGLLLMAQGSTRTTMDDVDRYGPGCADGPRPSRASPPPS